MTDQRLLTARFVPFAGTRYDEELARLSEVVAPPYDVVGPAERERLSTRSPYNAIHLELPEPDPVSGADRYEHAAALLSAWEREGVLRRDDVASLYVYKMQFADELGVTRSTLGVIGALKVTDEASVLPHEHTTPKPKDDRLNLLRATRTNLSPIWTLSPTLGLTKCLEDATSDLPAPISATDDDEVLHELWPIVEPALLEAISAAVEENAVLIADGHHRFETARAYASERRERNGADASPSEFIMAYVVELVEAELHVGAIHRLVPTLSDENELLTVAGRHFDLVPAPSTINELVRAMEDQGAIAFVSRNGNHLLLGKTADSATMLDAHRADLLLDELGLERSYQHGALECVEMVARGEADGALLLRPVSVDQIAATARGAARMPPKTTFFYPKPRTGMVFRTF